MAKIVLSKQPDERRSFYTVNVWAIKANGVEVGRVQREMRPLARAKRFEAITDYPLFRYQKPGQEPKLVRRKRFETLALLRSYLSRMPVVDRLVSDQKLKSIALEILWGFDDE